MHYSDEKPEADIAREKQKVSENCVENRKKAKAKKEKGYLEQSGKKLFCLEDTATE